jgi:hypothetical protein
MVFTVWAGESESPHDELAEGRQEGHRDEAASVTLRQLNRRCGPLSEATTAQIQAYDGLRDLARLHHRSMQEQARLLIEREVRLSQSDGLERARQWRAHFSGRSFPSLESDLRADRDR